MTDQPKIPKLPKAVEDLADTVLRYRPKPKSDAAKPGRKRQAVRASYYNEIDPYAATWLRNLIAAGLIAPGDVDERSIVDVHPSDLAGFTQCHFFAGIGGWSYALRLSGWPAVACCLTQACSRRLRPNERAPEAGW